MAPYYNNTPLIKALERKNVVKANDDKVFFVFSTILILTSVFTILYCQHKMFNKVIGNIQAENNKVKKK